MVFRPNSSLAISWKEGDLECRDYCPFKIFGPGARCWCVATSPTRPIRRGGHLIKSTQRTWHQLTVLADDVAIRTSNHHGTELRQFTELTGAWIESVDMHSNPQLIDPVMLDAFDDLKAAIFNVLFGWYRFSIAGMRNVLELMAIGCWAEVCGEKQKFTDGRTVRTPFLWARRAMGS
jgi:hypothetical protein